MIHQFVLDLPNMKFLTRKTWSQHPKRPGKSRMALPLFQNVKKLIFCDFKVTPNNALFGVSFKNSLNVKGRVQNKVLKSGPRPT